MEIILERSRNISKQMQCKQTTAGAIITSLDLVDVAYTLTTMPKVKEIPEATRKQIIQLRSEGLTYRVIAERVNVLFFNGWSNSPQASSDWGSLQPAKSWKLRVR